MRTDSGFVKGWFRACSGLMKLSLSNCSAIFWELKTPWKIRNWAWGKIYRNNGTVPPFKLPMAVIPNLWTSPCHSLDYMSNGFKWHIWSVCVCVWRVCVFLFVCFVCVLLFLCIDICIIIDIYIYIYTLLYVYTFLYTCMHYIRIIYLHYIYIHNIIYI